MCWIGAKPPGVTLPLDVVEKAWKSNTHGWGLAYWAPFDQKTIEETGRTVGWYYEKGMTLAGLKEAVEKNVVDERWAVVHCRIASRGAVKLANNHPFLIPGLHGLLFHNGTLPIKPEGDSTDSQALAEWLGKLPDLRERLADADWCKFLEHLIGFSKVVIASATADEPVVTFFNKSLGTESEGLWGSHGGPFAKPLVVTTGEWAGAGYSHYEGTHEATQWFPGAKWHNQKHCYIGDGDKAQTYSSYQSDIYRGHNGRYYHRTASYYDADTGVYQPLPSSTPRSLLEATEIEREIAEERLKVIEGKRHARSRRGRKKPTQAEVSDALLLEELERNQVLEQALTLGNEFAVADFVRREPRDAARLLTALLDRGALVADVE